MLKIIKAESARDLRHFYGSSRIFGYSKEESKYLKLNTSPAGNPIRICTHRAYLFAEDDKKLLARALTWTDKGYPGKGFFALLDGNAALLLGEIEKIQTEWGSSVLEGPISPDGSGFFHGACKADAEYTNAFNLKPFDTEVLRSRGYVPCERYRGFEAEPFTDEKLGRAAERTLERYGYTVKSLAFGLFNDPLDTCVNAFAKPPYVNETLRQAERIEPFLLRRLCYGAFDKHGVCRGYLLTLKGAKPRVCTLVTDSSAACVLLINAVNEGCRRLGIYKAEVSVISAGNVPSLMIAERAGARFSAGYFCYRKILT